MPQKLSEQEINRALENSPWQVQNGKLRRDFKFSNFVEAFGFLTQVAIHAEKMNHHPELYNVYNNVTIELVTHDVDGISDLDFKLAETINTLTS